ncbi:hypothetical protein O7599_23020 [Streptomyces sp. WMMC500]|uniref:hypothetical protein n=1 Tax=Streptomyces sp. WMMC500 TaxID=3015154 RepID=UPI00248C9A59|nr:hypothetical protein [Streptomyces sp. WMMC500]WBB58498.1 hypothetical protein O7599_23020 [Streptomyces sp. WMMC500]
MPGKPRKPNHDRAVIADALARYNESPLDLTDFARDDLKEKRETFRYWVQNHLKYGVDLKWEKQSGANRSMALFLDWKESGQSKEEFAAARGMTRAKFESGIAQAIASNREAEEEFKKWSEGLLREQAAGGSAAPTGPAGGYDIPSQQYTGTAGPSNPQAPYAYGTPAPTGYGDPTGGYDWTSQQYTGTVGPSNPQASYAYGLPASSGYSGQAHGYDIPSQQYTGTAGPSNPQAPYAYGTPAPTGYGDPTAGYDWANQQYTGTAGPSNPQASYAYGPPASSGYSGQTQRYDEPSQPFHGGFGSSRPRSPGNGPAK